MIRSPRHTLTRILLLTAAAVLLLAGCRKELCHNHWEHGYNVRAQVIPEWELEWRRDYGYGGSLFDWFQSSLPAFTLSPLEEDGGWCAKLQGLSLRKLGLMTGIDYAYLSTIENGSANTTVDTLLKICDALDVELTVVLSPRATA